MSFVESFVMPMATACSLPCAVIVCIDTRAMGKHVGTTMISTSQHSRHNGNRAHDASVDVRRFYRLRGRRKCWRQPTSGLRDRPIDDTLKQRADTPPHTRNATWTHDVGAAQHVFDRAFVDLQDGQDVWICSRASEARSTHVVVSPTTHICEPVATSGTWNDKSHT